MTPKIFCLITGVLFLAGALAHLVRLFLGLHVTIGMTVIPLWVSLVVAIGCGYLGYEGLKLSRTQFR